MRENTWRTITAVERAHAITAIQELPEITDKQKRDKAILTYFVIDGISASAICRRDNPLIVGMGNRSNGKPLSPSSILSIVYSYFPGFKKEHKIHNDDMRVELLRKRQKSPSEHIKSCAFCGSTDSLEEHHMIPLAMGGTNDDRNLMFLCHACHVGVTQYQKQLLRKTNNRG